MILTRRKSDLRIEYVFQDISDKEQFLVNFMEEKNIEKEKIIYMGRYQRYKSDASFWICCMS